MLSAKNAQERVTNKLHEMIRLHKRAIVVDGLFAIA
jgi:hypothetical protein